VFRGNLIHSPTASSTTLAAWIKDSAGQEPKAASTLAALAILAVSRIDDITHIVSIGIIGMGQDSNGEL